MPRYRVSGTVTGSKYLGEIDADSPEDAEAKVNAGALDCSVCLCHACSEQCQDPVIETLHLTSLNQHSDSHKQRGFMNNKKTCGELLYLDALSRLTTEAERRAFAAGFVSGQAEKVYLGACPAAMFRPSDETFEGLLVDVVNICDRYQLGWQVIGGDNGIAREIWIFRHGVIGIGEWLQFPKNSAAWHAARARACGIPEHEIDWDFHERKGYEQPCDQGALVDQPS